MAARIEAAPSADPVELIDLRHISSRQIEPLLEEETEAWNLALDWDFEKSADLVRRFVDLRALNGCALIEDGHVAGYGYYVLEEHKGLVGDLYVRARSRTAARENCVLGWILQAIASTPAIRRVESQLMMIDTGPGRATPLKKHLQTYERNFMRVQMAQARLGAGSVRRPMYIERWSDHYQEAAAQLIASSYAGHVDSMINDQYRSHAGARKFLFNIVQYPGCGTFYRPASYASFDATTGRLVGISLASLVASGSGHITQICVAPGWRGAGLGREMLRQSLVTLREAGCGNASLTVTASNHEAILLYEQIGFVTVRRFSAYVWEGF